MIPEHELHRDVEPLPWDLTADVLQRAAQLWLDVTALEIAMTRYQRLVLR